jgi:hypothetical protein
MTTVGWSVFCTVLNPSQSETNVKLRFCQMLSEFQQSMRARLAF